MFQWLKKFLKPPFINSDSSLREVVAHYPHTVAFLKDRYRLSLEEQDLPLSLAAFAKKHRLPTPQILFMEIQTSLDLGKIKHLSATELAQALADTSAMIPKVLDARESWELPLGAIPGSRALSQELWEDILNHWDKSEEIVVYCHFGVRSLDVAHELLKAGFKKVGIVKGGIDSWSELVDPAIPKYTGAYC